MDLKALMQKLETINGKQYLIESEEKEQTDKKPCPPMSHVKKMCQDGKSVAEICKMHPDCDHTELKQMVADCKETMSKDKKKTDEGIVFTSSIARSLTEEFGYALDEEGAGGVPDETDAAYAKRMAQGQKNLNAVKGAFGMKPTELKDAPPGTPTDPAIRSRLGVKPATPDEIASSQQANPGGLRTSDGKPVLDGSGKPWATGSTPPAVAPAVAPAGPDAAAQASRIADRMDAEAGANTAGTAAPVAAKPPAGSVDPNAGELGGKNPDELANIKKNAGVPAAPAGVQAQGDDEGNTMITRPDGTTMVVGPDGNAIKPGTNPNLPTNKAQAAALASGAQDDVTGVDAAVAAQAAAGPGKAPAAPAAAPKVAAKPDPAVKKLQQDLIAKGAKIKDDGYMGPATQAAQKQFSGGQAASPTAKPAAPAAGAPAPSLINRFRASRGLPTSEAVSVPTTAQVVQAKDDQILAIIRNIRV